MLVCVGSIPMYIGFSGFEISTNEVPLLIPTSAYSLLVWGSVHPHISFNDEEFKPPISVLSENDIRSISLHANWPAKPFTHSTLFLIDEISPAVEKLLVRNLL